ncbi:biotin--[acetyl-CoA-carboxylase] ligase [Candidatus Bathyarchaeota archaeon]|nr:MAG: biotin--[acetyl-CoA-carboxylase] ligase [Candidatus Bathyarchaeota archaeon]
MGFKLFELGRVGSTNDVARELASRGWPEWTVVVAEEQTSGRGRFGREWISPRGGLWFSIILRPRLDRGDLQLLPLVAGLAVAETLSSLYGLDAELRWPNDILIGGRKVCGILVENSFSGEELLSSIVGIGINANFGLEELPEGVREGATTLLYELGHPVDLGELLSACLSSFRSYYEVLLRGEKALLLSRVRELLGLPVEVVLSEGELTFSGLALDLADDGSLLVRLPDGTTRPFGPSSTVLSWLRLKRA